MKDYSLSRALRKKYGNVSNKTLNKWKIEENIIDKPILPAKEELIIEPIIAPVMKSVKKKKKLSFSQVLLRSNEWKILRQEALSLYEHVCMKCGTKENIQVDHIKPKFKYPELALDINNLQILCWSCNKEKSFHSETDYRQST